MGTITFHADDCTLICKAFATVGSSWQCLLTDTASVAVFVRSLFPPFPLPTGRALQAEDFIVVAMLLPYLESLWAEMILC